MRTFTLHAFLNNVLKQTRFRLVPKLKWSVTNLLSSENYSNQLKKQLFDFNCHWTINQLPSFSINSCQLEKLEMPRVMLDHSSNSEKKKIREDDSKSSKHRLKKKKKKIHHEHGHKRKHSKKHSSEGRLSVTKQVELVLLDLSSDNDSDVLIVYDSRDGLKNSKAKSVSQLLRGKRKPDDTPLPIGMKHSECMLEGDEEPNITDEQRQNNEVKESSSIRVKKKVKKNVKQVKSQNLNGGIESTTRRLKGDKEKKKIGSTTRRLKGDKEKKKKIGSTTRCLKGDKEKKKKIGSTTRRLKGDKEKKKIGSTTLCLKGLKEKRKKKIGSTSHTNEETLLVKSDQDNSGNQSALVCAQSSNEGCYSEPIRVWEKMSESSTGAPVSSREYLMFDVLSYNVLCQEIMEEHMNLYTYHNTTALPWDYRSRLLMQEFMQFNSDVLCLQEVQQSHLKSFYQELEKMGYGGLFKQRTGDKKDGVAIYYKKSVFDLIDHTSVEYYQPGVWILNRDNVGLIVKLAPKAKPSERIIIATTHLLYNPRRHDVKLAQIQILLAEVERFAFKEMDERTKSPKYWPVILTGDMNMEPCTGGYQLLTGGSFQFEGLSSKTLTNDFYGYSHYLGKELIPPSLGITDKCQHINIVKNRLKHSSVCSQTDHRAEESLLQIYNSDFIKKSRHSMADEMLNAQDFLKNSWRDFSTGQLSHTLQLCSVYHHDLVSYNKPQVSTFQDGWVVVDYIFYSDDGRSDVTGNSEGNLKLVARYKLFSEQEATIIGPIPNLSSPSDHYPLAAKFALLFE